HLVADEGFVVRRHGVVRSRRCFFFRRTGPVEQGHAMSRPSKRSEAFHHDSNFFDVPSFDWNELAARCLREAHRVADADDAADIPQEAMIRVWRSLRAGAVPEHPIAWLRTIVRREAFRHRNRLATTSRLDDHFDLSDRTAANRLDLLPLQVDVR